MLVVSSNISEKFAMNEPEAIVEDLEDGEIGSEDEDTNTVKEEIKKEEPAGAEEEKTQDKCEEQEVYYSKSGKKKKSKSHKGEQKFKDKNKKNRKYGNSTEDDFAGSIEKAIRKAMRKNAELEENIEDDLEERRKHKKRKKYDNKDSSSKKRKKTDYCDEMDESEMMCVRGASPVQKNSAVVSYPDEDKDSYESDSSQESRGHSQQRQQRHRPTQRERNKNKNDRRRGAHPMQDPDGVCLYYMQGKCHKGDDCLYSHDAQPPRKMELCKFYLMDCCAKRDKCLYMHADFPCKYYHTGLPCVYKDDCKFAHGKPLTDSLKNILLKHIESAPKEILGDFPRLNREGALKMIQNTQLKLMQQYFENTEPQEKTIPSLFDINVTNPQNLDLQAHLYNTDKNNKAKVRQSRWENDNANQNFSANISPNSGAGATDVLNIKNLTGVLTVRQISDLTKMGIENLDQLGQLTVMQLNNIGLTLSQISEIQLNTMSIQKLGLISANLEQNIQQYTPPVSGSKDLDLRVPPVVSVANSLTTPADLPEKDVDMRFQPSTKQFASDDVKKSNKIEVQTNKDMIDIDQYTKDALKFASKDKENVDLSNEPLDSEKTIPSNESKDVDHRVLPFSDESSRNLPPSNEHNTIRNGSDTDIRFLQPEPLFKNPEKRHRRSTTDDDDDNLLIDEKWYSSDEEKSAKIKKSPASSPQSTPSSLQPAPHIIEPASVLSRLGDLSKIDISEEVTKLLNTMKNNLNDGKHQESPESSETKKSRDHRSRRSPDKATEVNKNTSKKPTRVSIYDCIDGEPTDGRRRSDVDLRQTDFRPVFGDTDLRQGNSGDIDFRLGLPFKAIPNYTPASEIDGSINSHPPIPYKLVLIEIPRPDYTDIRNSTAKSQALLDPRLRKVFRLSLDDSNSDSEKSVKVTTPVGPRVDPRRKLKDSNETVNQEPKVNALDLQSVLQNSNWYKDLSSTQKIFVNQNLAPVTQMIKKYQQEKTPGSKFDLTSIQNNNILGSIFANLGISLGDTGEYFYLPKPKEALLKTPVNFNQNPNNFGMAGNMTSPMDGNNMNMMNIPPMNMNMGHHGYNQSFSDPRSGPAPGLLGIAPNIPHNFAPNKFGGPNFSNMPFNGGGNDFNNFNMEGEQNYPRFSNRGGHRGRGNDRWNRGGPGRGRKNFNDRGNWNNDRQ